MNQGGPQFQMVVPLTRAVKWIIIANIAVWVGLVLILQNFVLHTNAVFEVFGLVPGHVINDFWIWQLFTYMFLHSPNVFHILFNMLIFWWFGAELETRWGSRFFVLYCLVCGVGAGFVYLAGVLIHYFWTSTLLSMATPLVGASGVAYGLLLAYGLLFGERVIYFMMLFPMKAKYFTMIIGFVEFVTLLDAGLGSKVANLAHLGGLATGFLFLLFVARWRTRKSSGGVKRGRRLKLVVNNERSKSSDDGPRYWN
jgi:membrane associated rhomboid family serine protease